VLKTATTIRSTNFNKETQRTQRRREDNQQLTTERTNKMNQRLFNLAQTIWDYHKLNQHLEKSDAILVLCSHDERVAERSVELFNEGWAPLIIFSGGAGAITRTLWTEPEAKRFARIALEAGVPRENILIEDQSTNTGDNVRFTRTLLEERGLALQRFIVVQKPYMERRSYATFRKLWPEKDVLVTSPQTSFQEYLRSYSNSSLSTDDVVGIMVGDLQRIKLYPTKGFQIEQEIPVDTWAAYDELVAAGYTKYLVTG
jgi:uncharacterized SAM-binding protein YcdF (DUF218 family)